jgi:hypothetical protein
MRGAMKKVGNIARVCTSLRRGRAQLRDWRALVDVSWICALNRPRPHAHHMPALSAANELRDHAIEVGLSHRLVIVDKVRLSQRDNLNCADQTRRQRRVDAICARHRRNRK